MALPNYNSVLLRMEKRASWFVIGAVLVVLLVLGAIAVKHEYFSRSTALYFITDDAQGLSKGMAVKLIGFKVGSVESISMQQDATVRVQMSLNNDYMHFIGKDAKARLMKEGLVGEGVVEIIPGDEKAKRMEANGMLEFERGQDVGSIAEDMADRIEPILDDVKQITGTLNNSRGGIREIMTNLNAASIELRKTTEEVSKLSKGGNEKVDALYVKVDRALDKANSGLDALEHSLPNLISKADSTLNNVQGATEDIRKITAESSQQVPALVRNANALVQDGQQAVNGAKKSWLLQGLFPQPEEQLLPSDSYAPPGSVK